MKRIVIQRLIVFLLAILTGLVLLWNVPWPLGVFVTPHLGSGLLYLSLTAFALYTGALLSESEFGPVHAIGMMAFLALPSSAQPAMTWALFLGSVLGGGALVGRRRLNRTRRRRIRRDARVMLVISARVTLSFFVAGAFFQGIGGTTPIDSVPPSAASGLFFYSLVYIVLYSGIYMLEVYSEGHSIQQLIRENASELLTILVVPIPFSVLGAVIYNQLQLEFFIFVLVGLVISIIAMSSYSHTQRQLREKLSEMRALAALSNDLQTDTRLETLVQTLCANLPDLLDVDNIILTIKERDGEYLSFPLVIRRGECVESIRESEIDRANIALLNEVLDTENPLLISSDVALRLQHMGMTPHSTPVQSWLGAPFRVGDRTQGALAMISTSNRIFMGPDLRLLKILTSTIGVTVDNARLQQQQSNYSQQLSTLNTVSILLSSTLSTDTVIDTIATSASMLSECDGVSVYLDDGDEKPVMVRTAGMSMLIEETPPSLLLPRYEMIKTQSDATLDEVQPVIVKNVHSDERTPHLRGVLAEEGMISFVELPFIQGDALIGAVVLYFEKETHFDTETIELLRTFANESVQAIKNARLYTSTDEALERRVEQLFALAAIGRQMNATVDIDTISYLVLNYATDATSAPRGVLALYDEHGKTLAIHAQRGFPDGTFSNTAFLEKGIASELREQQQLIRIDDMQSQPQGIRLMPDTRSQLAVPVLRDQELLGLLVLEHSDNYAFNEEDSYFVMQLVNQTAIAIDNHHLFRRISEARDRLQVILDTMTEGIVLVDRDGRIVLANPAVRLIGLDPDQLLNRQLDDLLEHPTPKTNLIEKMGFESEKSLQRLMRGLRQPAESWADGKPEHYMVAGEHGSLHIQRQIIPIPAEDGEMIGLLFVLYDETEKRELDRTRDDISRMIVHDLRSPLTAVTTSLRLLREVIPDESDYRPVVDKTTDASQRAIRKLLRRVDSLLDISKMESGEIELDKEIVQLHATVENVFDELRPLAKERSIELVADLPNDIPLLFGDGDKLERVVQNLVDNALKYTPANTSVTVRSHPPGVLGAPPDQIRVDVIDMGSGVPPEYKERLFDRFVQIRGRRGIRRGVGLGLTFCKLVVEAHDGRIWIEDNPQGGSIFMFTLPVSTIQELPE